MSDWIKWAAIGAAVVIAITAIAELFTGFDTGYLGTALSSVVNIAGDALRAARGFLNMFFPQSFLTVLTWFIGYIIIRPFSVRLIMMTLGAVKVIFK